MIHSEHLLNAPNDTTLQYQSWRPDTGLRAVALVVHGAAEHGGRYARFADQLGSSGFAVATVDLPGHGKSSGKRCRVTHFDQYIDAVERAHLWAEQEFSTHQDAAGEVARPLFFLVGHSMGGLIASLYLQRHQARFAGAVFSGAALVAEPEPPKFQLLILRALARLFPSAGALQLDAGGVSRDPEVVAGYVNDPLVYTGKLPVCMLAAMFKAMQTSAQGMEHLTVPMLVLHGDADRLVSPRASQLLIERAGSVNKSLRLYPGLFHEIFNEPERESVVDDLIRWASARLPDPS